MQSKSEFSVKRMMKGIKMGRRKRRRKKKSNKRVIVTGIILGVLIVLAVFIYRKSGGEDDYVNENVQKKELEETALEFPYVVEDGKLEIISVFPFSGTNPDFNDEDCENVGAVQVINKSEEHLVEADIYVLLSDGSKLQFRLEEIPSGKETIAFETNNAEYDQTIKVIEIKAETEYSLEKEMDQGEIAFRINEEEITITNVSDKELANISVKYHCSLNGMYFGGKCYEGVIGGLKPEESVSVDASECYLGEVTVVDITY